MKRLRKQHVLEQSIYGAIWIVIFLLPLIGGYFAMSGGLEREETRMVIRESWLSILPFFVLFLLNNYGLVPYFLFKKRYWQYTVSLIFVIGMICWLSPFPSANHFPKDFKRGELPLRMKENRRDQIIKTREKEGYSTMIRGSPYGFPPVQVLHSWQSIRLSAEEEILRSR
jgi:hypothetical protein